VASSGAGTTAIAVTALAISVLAFALRPKGVDAPESDADLRDSKSLENRINDAEGRLEAVEQRQREAAERMAKVERLAQEAAGNAARAVDLVKTGGGASPVVDAKDRPTEQVRNEKKEAMLAAIREGRLGEGDVMGIFGEAKDLGFLDDALAELEKYAAANAQDADAQADLASAYVVKLMSVSNDMEKGTWSMKSIQACERALKVDPEHWGAQFVKGMNLSQWPDFLGKQPEAIRTFERLVEQQERSAPEPHFAETYYHLGNLYRKTGNAAKALEVFKKGLALFPDDKTLREQIEVLEKR
jgi:tetratricopeptide (TPR) repeat protein